MLQQVQQQQLMQQPQLYLEPQWILTFGLSQHGKSSFINTICRENLCKVGSNGQSCTQKIETFSAKQINGQVFNFIDLPGVVDSNCLYDNEEYKKKMVTQLQYILVTLNIKKPNIRAIIIVLSLSESTCQLTKCINEVKKFLKNSSKVEVDTTNIILVLTKWQLMKDDDLKEYLYINGFYEYNYVMWENDIYKKDMLATPVAQDQFNIQLDNLLLIIQKCQSYNLGIPSMVQKDIEDLQEQYLKDQQLFKKHKVEIGIALSKTERIRSWIRFGLQCTASGGSIWIGGDYYLEITRKKVDTSRIGQAIGGIIVSGVVFCAFSYIGYLGEAMVDGIKKPSEQECKSLAEKYTFFNILKKAGVNDQ